MIGIDPFTGPGLSLPNRFVDALERLLEVVQPRRDGAERVAVLEVVALEPARADAEDRATAGDVVDRARHVGEQIRVAVGVAADERAELHALGHLRERGEQRPALEVRPVGIAVQRVEVIPDVDAVDAEILGAEPCLAELREAPLLRVERGADAYLLHRRED